VSGAAAPRLIPDVETAERLLRADSATLASALQIPLPEARRDVQILLTRALGGDLGTLLGHPERVPHARATDAYSQAFARRLGGEPMAYLLGEREFYGLRIEVTAEVLIPRPETELVVEMALERLPETGPARVLDMGTGSGCIGVTLAKLRPGVHVIASDVSEAALSVAARNAQRERLHNIEFRLGSWFEPLAGEQFDVIVSNPPYVALGDPHLQEGDLRAEPHLALVAGSDGLEALRAIVLGASEYLLPAATLILEHGHDQAQALAELLAAARFRNIVSRTDLAGIARVAAGRRP